MRVRDSAKRTVPAVVALGICCGAWAAGTEAFGNMPLAEANYTVWPGIVPVVNHPTRVYHTWVNGNEHFYYKGETPAALNDLLQRFAEAKTGTREVVFRPGTGTTRSFDRTKEIAYGWSLHLVGGIARHLTTLDQGAKVWPPHPVLTVYADTRIELEKVALPRGITVTSLQDVNRRTRDGLKSTDKTVRGWTCGVLAELDPYDAGSRDAIAALLKDPDNWVRLNAALALRLFGKRAEPALPLLRAARETADERLKAEVETTIREIERAEPQPEAERRHLEGLERISRFLAAQKAAR